MRALARRHDLQLRHVLADGAGDHVLDGEIFRGGVESDPRDEIDRESDMYALQRFWRHAINVSCGRGRRKRFQVRAALGAAADDPGFLIDRAWPPRRRPMLQAVK